MSEREKRIQHAVNADDGACSINNMTPPTGASGRECEQCGLSGDQHLSLGHCITALRARVAAAEAERDANARRWEREYHSREAAEARVTALMRMLDETLPCAPDCDCPPRAALRHVRAAAPMRSE